MFRALRPLIGITLLWLSCAAAQAAEIMTLPPGQLQLKLEQVDLLEDPQATLSLQDVSEGAHRYRFSPTQTHLLRLLPSQSNTWLRFSLENPEATPRRLLLEMPQSRLLEIALFSGHAQQPVFHSPPDTFELLLPAHSVVTYHLRLRTHSALKLQPSIYTEQAYLQHRARQEWFVGGSFATTALICVGALAFWLILRERVYLYFLGYALAHFLHETAAAGFLKLWLTPGSQASYFLFWGTGFLVNTAGLLAAWGLIQGGPRDRLWGRAMVALMLANVLAVASGGLDADAPGYLLYPLVFANLSVITLASLDHFMATQRAILLIYGLLNLLVIGLLTTAGLLEQSLLTEFGIPRPVIASAVNVQNILVLLLLLLNSRQQMERRHAKERDLLVAEAESRSQSAIVSRVSHELRTPISGVMGIAELLLDTPLTEHQRDYVETIQQSGHNALDIVNNVVDFSRIEAGHMALQHVPFTLSAVVMEAVESFRTRAEEKQLELICNVSETIPHTVTGDPTRLRQILLHLIDNAIKFTEQGEVVVSVARVGEESSPLLRFEVSDTGPGISPQEQRLLLPSGGTPPMAQESRHNGIGLAIARRLVGMMGGEMGLDSELGRGARFWFQIAMEELPTGADSERQFERTLNGLRLLVVDDNDTSRKVIQEHASRWGMQITGAHSGSEALALIRSRSHIGEPFDIVVVDQHMPGMTGLQLAEKLRDDLKLSPPPLVVMLTGASQMPGSAATRACGIRRVLTKPVSARTLKLTLAEEMTYQRGPLQTPVERDPVQPEPKPDFSHLNILVAEDNPISAKVISGMLRKLGVRARTVGNGQQAVEATQRQSFDLIFMDCEMPILDGLEATRQIRQRERDSHRSATPIIALTAHTLDEHRESSLLAGMNAHLCKPVELAELQAALEQWTRAAAS